METSRMNSPTFSPVDFMIIGVQKCGTTSLAHLLSQHPEIDFCHHKEPDFFSTEADWKQKLESYNNLFKNNSTFKIKGEASTTYSWLLEYPETAERLFQYNPDLKFIYMVRNPIDRITSHYMHEYARGRAGKDMEREILYNPKYLQHTLYYAQLQTFMRLFPRENFHFVLFDDFVNDSEKTLTGVLKFLKIGNISMTEINTEAQNQTLKRKGEYKIKRKLAPYVRFIPLGIRDRFRYTFEFPIKSKMEIGERQKIQLLDMLAADIEKFSALSGIKFK